MHVQRQQFDFTVYVHVGASELKKLTHFDKRVN